jgi:hypothetical protein
LVEEIGIAGENYRPAASHWQTFSHNVVSITWSHYLIPIEIPIFCWNTRSPNRTNMSLIKKSNIWMIRSCLYLL